MQILNRYNTFSLLPTNFSECCYISKLVAVLNENLSDEYALQFIYKNSIIKTSSKNCLNFAIHIGNEINFDDQFYDQFDFIFRFYLSDYCDFKKVFPINIGYNSSGYENIGLPFNHSKELSERSNKLFFWGNKFSRMNFYNNTKSLKEKYNINFSEGFRQGIPINSFRDILSDSIICLAPGGDSPESFRFSEGFASGCVVITDFHSDVWYLKESPSIYLSSWSDLTQELIFDIISHLDLGDYKNRAINYYYKNLSPEANAEFIIKTIKT